MILTLPAVNSLFVDVDGTLLLWPGKPGRVPRHGEPHYGEPPTINSPLVDALYAWKAVSPGRFLAVWTRGGAEHARMAVALCAINAIVDVCILKPDAFVDDAPTLVKRLIVISPR